MEDIARGVLAGIATGCFVSLVVEANLLALKTLALEKYQRDYAQYQKDRTQLLDWVAQQDREKNKAFHDFQDTDAALALYNQTHRAKVAMPNNWLPRPRSLKM